MNGPAMLHAGVIGLGVGERHISGYERHPMCQVTRLVDFSAEKRADVATRHPGRVIDRDADDILNDPDIDVVSIASYDQHHFDQIVRALEQGKHVFVEKPLVMTERHAHEVRERLNRNPHLKLSSNLILRRCPRFLQLKQDMAKGTFGDVFHIDADYQYGRIEKLLSGWRGELPDYSLVMGGAVHMVDLILWLTGEKPVEVVAMGNRMATGRAKGMRHDLVQAEVRFESGMVASIGCNGGCVHPHFHKLEVYGTEASFVNGLESAFVYRSRDPGIAPELVTEAYPGVDKGDLLEDFVDAVLHDRAPEVDADAVFSALALCFAIERAAETGRPQRVQSI